jgi:flavodoxin
MNKALVAYFSASGITKSVADSLAKALDQADLFEILPEIPYTKADLNWMNKQSRSSVEMDDPSSRPKIAYKVSNMEEYDTVFIGFPIWWYVAPHIINSFLESYDFSNKTLIPFATSGSSGMGKTEEILQGICPQATWKQGKMLNGKPAEKALTDWVRSLGL